MCFMKDVDDTVATTEMFCQYILSVHVAGL